MSIIENHNKDIKKMAAHIIIEGIAERPILDEETIYELSRIVAADEYITADQKSFAYEEEQRAAQTDNDIW